MADVTFNFQNSWTMGQACGTVANPSINPAPITTPCIYIIHNYAQNRWASRSEVFHQFGIPRAYADNILCAYCQPTITRRAVMLLKGQNNCEHLLIRAVFNGLLLGNQPTITNTQLIQTPFNNPIATSVTVHLPTVRWGRLTGSRQVAVNANF